MKKLLWMTHLRKFSSIKVLMFTTRYGILKHFYKKIEIFKFVIYDFGTNWLFTTKIMLVVPCLSVDSDPTL